MRYFVGFMMFAFLLGGGGLVVAGVRELILKLYRLTYFRRATGSIVKVVREKPLHGSGTVGRRGRAHYRFFPVIKFKHLSGEEVTFRSEIGDGGETSRYRVGQRIGVAYDIDDRFAPMINSFSGIWLPAILMILMGVVFIGGGLTIYFAFGAKIFGKI